MGADEAGPFAPQQSRLCFGTKEWRLGKHDSIDGWKSSSTRLRTYSEVETSQLYTAANDKYSPRRGSQKHYSFNLNGNEIKATSQIGRGRSDHDDKGVVLEELHVQSNVRKLG